MAKRKMKSRYYVVNCDCAAWFTNLQKAIKEIKNGYFGNELTYIYYIGNIDEYDFDKDLTCKTYEDLLKLILKSPSRKHFENEMMIRYKAQVFLAMEYAKKVFGEDFPPYQILMASGFCGGEKPSTPGIL